MHDINFEKIGKKLKEIRISRGLTQEYIASMADVNTSHISNIENNRVKISLSTLIRVCNAMNTTVDYVLNDEYAEPSSVLDQTILSEIQECDRDTKEKILKIIQIMK